MPWNEVTVKEQRQNFICDYRLGYYTISDLAASFGISRKTAYKWIDRWEQHGAEGLRDLSRRPRSSPWQTPEAIRKELLAVRRFGYSEYEQSLQIQPEQTAYVQVQLQKAPFQLHDISVSRVRFNPSNPGPPGTTLIRFQVSSYGSGTVTIQSADGRPVSDAGVRTFVVNNFDTWNQHVSWDGRDASGKVVPDGTYVALVELQSAEGGALQQDTAVIHVDSSSVIRFRNMLSGNPGLAYAPIPDTLPDGSEQLATEFLGRVGTDSSGAVIRQFPIMAGV